MEVFKLGRASCSQQSLFSVHWVLVLPADTACENEYPVVVGKPSGKHIMSGNPEKRYEEANSLATRLELCHRLLACG
jgi:hypothetical protein